MWERPGRPRKDRIGVTLKDASTGYLRDRAIDRWASGLLEVREEVDRQAGKQKTRDRGALLGLLGQAHGDGAVQDQELEGPY